MRPIDADELKTAFPCSDNSKHVLVASVRATINHMPTIEQQQQWIPCSEMSPEEQEADYWICTDTGYQCQCRWTSDRYGLGGADKWGWKLFDIPQYTHVVAWMPLPAPYKTE